MAVSISKFQDDIVNNVDLEKLLTEAYAISIQVHDLKMKQWCHDELNGYSNIDEVPNYRKLTVELVADGIIRPNIPTRISKEEEKYLNQHIVMDSIPSIIRVVERNNDGYAVFKFPSKMSAEINELYFKSAGNDLTFKQVTSIGKLIDIESAVKDKIIEWGMNLKAEEEPKKNNESRSTTIINNNISGNVENSQFQQGNTNSKQKKSSWIIKIKDLLGSLFDHLIG